MVKLEVTLDFPNAGLYEDFLEAAAGQGLTPDAYLLWLVAREAGISELCFDTDGPEG